MDRLRMTADEVKVLHKRANAPPLLPWMR